MQIGAPQEDQVFYGLSSKAKRDNMQDMILYHVRDNGASILVSRYCRPLGAWLKDTGRVYSRWSAKADNGSHNPASRPPDFNSDGLSNEHRHGIAVEDLFLLRGSGIGNKVNKVFVLRFECFLRACFILQIDHCKFQIANWTPIKTYVQYETRHLVIVQFEIWVVS